MTGLWTTAAICSYLRIRSRKPRNRDVTTNRAGGGVRSAARTQPSTAGAVQIGNDDIGGRALLGRETRLGGDADGPSGSPQHSAMEVALRGDGLRSRTLRVIERRVPRRGEEHRRCRGA